MQHLFGNANFRRLFFGRVVTNAGDSLYSVAAMWLVYSLTGSTFYTGIAGMLTLGMQALQAFVGPLVDRWPLSQTLVWTQAAQGILVLTIPLAAYFDLLSVWLVLTVMPLVSLLNQFVYPASSSALPRIVEGEDLTSANSLFSMSYQGAELVFNAAAGVLVAVIGATTLFLIDSVTFAVAVALFAGIRVPPAERDEEDNEQGYVAELKAGIRYLRGSMLVWILGASILANGLLGMAWPVLPAFADLRGDSSIYGLLLASLAAGSLIGAFIAPKFEDVPFGTLSIVGYLVSAAAWLAALRVDSIYALVILFGVSFVPVGIGNIVAMTLIQRLVPEAMLGRVVAVMGSASTAAMPLGALLGGIMGDVFGPLTVMYAGGIGFLWIVAYIALIPTLRRMPAATAVETESPAGNTGKTSKATNAD